MKKWILPLAIAVIAVIAVGVYFFVSPETDEYSGSTYYSDCSMNIDNDSFELTYTKYADNSYFSSTYIYKGKIAADRFVVGTYTEQYREHGKIYKENTENGISVSLSEMILFRQVSGGYIVNDTFINRSVNTPSYELLYVTTQEAQASAGCDITLLKGSSKSDIANMTIVEMYSDGTISKYSVDEELIGDTDLSTVGVKRITVGYGGGRIANLSLEIVPFILEKNETMERGTTFEYAQKTEKIVFEKAEGIGEISAEPWDSTDGTKRISLKCGDYSKSVLVTFTSDSDRSVLYGGIGTDPYFPSGTDLPVLDISMTLKNGKVYNIQSNDPQVSVSGYDKNVKGSQTVKISYQGSQFGIVLYSYDSSNLVPKDAYLVNVNKTYDSRDGLLLYTEKGVNYSDYSIKYIMCDGSVRNTPLTEDMVTYSGTLDAEQRPAVEAKIEKIIESYRYSESVIAEYDTTEEDIKGSLTFSSIIGSRTSACYTMETGAGTYHISFGYRVSEFYVAHDLVSSSSYFSNRILYTYEGNDAFTLFLSKDNAMDMNRSILAGAELVKYTINPGDILIAEFSAVMTETDAAFFKGLGISAGDTAGFTVTYDRSTGMTTAMNVSKGSSVLASGTFSYGEGVVLSDNVKKYVSNTGTVTVIMKYGDGKSDQYYSINAGLKDLSFRCDEGYGVFVKKGDIYEPFVMPVSGITTSVELYYRSV